MHGQHPKTEAWIYDVAGAARHGWLEIREENGEMRPADGGWQRVAGFPSDDAPGSAHVAMWSDQRDKYVLRLDLGNIQRWMICERLPALLHAIGAVQALVQLGRR
ncbi:MAG: hypothetical protein U0802_00605 [Candidatus Binatia bacterium]